MRKLIIAALLAGQVTAVAQPAMAADFTNAREERAGAFAGFRLRMALDGARRRQLRAGFALAPTRGTRDVSGETRIRIGEGFEFGYRSGRPLSVSLAGQDLNGRRFGAAQDDSRGDAVPRVALAVLAVGATLGLLYWGVSEALDCDPGDDC